MATLFRSFDFLGPNFVRGLALQEKHVLVISETEARVIMFPGGFDDQVKYTVTFYGEGFGKTEDGRFTGTVSRFVAEGSDGTSWHVFGYNASLNSVNTAATQQDFIQNLLVPIEWEYVGNRFDDVFIGGSFGDTFLGFGGDDTFQGLGGDDTIVGGPGNDTLNGEGDNDTIFGGPDDDIIRGGPGSDRLSGGTGMDLILGEAGADEILAGEGDDTVEGGGQGDTILGERGDDTLLGQDGSDTIDGGAGQDTVDGGNGTDILLGGADRDIVQGGASSDFIIGGLGDDLLAGNTTSEVDPDFAPDIFIFEGRFGHDTISDFEIDWDSIYLVGIARENVAVHTINHDDVLITVTQQDIGESTILVQGVAGEFDRNVDIVFNDSPVEFTGIDALETIAPIEFGDHSYNVLMAEKATQVPEDVLCDLIDLYVAFFNRVPEASGLIHWIDQYLAGKTLDQIAVEFYEAGVAFSSVTGYSADMPLEEFVKVLYGNVAGRVGENAPTQSEIDFWVNEVNTGAVTREGLVPRFLDDARLFYGDPDVGYVPELLDNKLALGKLHAVTYGLDYEDPNTAIQETVALTATVTSSGFEVAAQQLDDLFWL